MIAAGWLGVPHEHAFGIHNLPYGVFTTGSDPRPRLGTRIGEVVLDLAATAALTGSEHLPLVAAPNLDRLLAAGPAAWGAVRGEIQGWLTDPAHREDVEPNLVALTDATLSLPFTVADYVDFYSSEHHARNLGRMFRPGQDELTPNWKHLPIGYHGRAGTVIASGTPVVRPTGQQRTPDGQVVFAATAKLDIEAEVGFVVGVPSALGSAVRLDAFADHVFGVCLVNDWSARDIQAWEYQPLGPFLGKSFATSISGWVVPLAALEAARVRPPTRTTELLDHLDDAAAEPWGLDLRLEVELNGQVISRPPFASMYWTAAQQLAHLTSNGASLRTGDLFASGTVSGPERDQCGSLIELSWGGAEPIELADGRSRTFLVDGDEVVVTATAPGPDGTTVGLGEVRGRILTPEP